MSDNRSFLPASLANPIRREELILYLKELAAENPLDLWRQDREQGLSSEIDQIFHFFFDDNDFDESAIGESLLDANEVEVIEEVKALLDAIFANLPEGDDAAFVGHPLWPRLRIKAQEAQSALDAPR